MYGDLTRWLQGPHTNSHRNWDDVFLALEAVSSKVPPGGYPMVDCDRAYRLATEGAPLQGDFVTTYDCVTAQNLRPPSRNLLKEAASLTDKLRKEEQLSCHILLPRFLWRFINGLHLCLLQFVFRHGDPKGRLCVDPSTQLNPTDAGNATCKSAHPSTRNSRSLGRKPPQSSTQLSCVGVFHGCGIFAFSIHLKTSFS